MRLVRLGFLISAITFAFAAAPSMAQAQEEAPKKKGPKAPGALPQKIHQEGEYGGVTQGSVGDTKKKRMPRWAKKYAALTWVGFKPLDDGNSRLFFQLGRDVPYTQEVVGKRLIIQLVGARPYGRNASRRLDLRFFDTSISVVTVKKVRARRARRNRPGREAGVEVVVRFKSSSDVAQASASMGAAEDGFTYLNLDFGPSSKRDN